MVLCLIGLLDNYVMIGQTRMGDIMSIYLNPESVVKSARERLFADINYDEKSKNHSCRIDRFVK